MYILGTLASNAVQADWVFSGAQVVRLQHVTGTS